MIAGGYAALLAFGGAKLIFDRYTTGLDEYATLALPGTIRRAGVGALFAVLLGGGGLLLFLRKHVGRWMVIVGAAIGLALALKEALTPSANEVPVGMLFDLGLVAGAATILIAALLPATGHWIQAGGPPAHPRHYPYN